MTSDRRDPTVDELFARFRTSGRPGLLAEVFDRTAPELLRVAIHTVRDLHRAEDLVQACFVRAIEKVRSYDTELRVLPWLLGILANLAKEQQRRERRTPDEARLTARTAEDPVVEARAEELEAAVDAAIQKMAESYRPVLVLHLRHGLEPIEIARALGRSPGTVRSQLARGLAALRRILPVGFAGALALAMMPTRGLAAVRQCVVRRAWRAWPRIVTASAATSLAAPRGMALAVCLLATSAVVLWTWRVGAESPGSEASLATGFAGVTSEAVVRDEVSQHTRKSLRSPATSGAGSGVVEVRVVDADGAPFALMTLRLVPRGIPDPLLSERRARTDERGIARFKGVPRGRYTVFTDRAPGPTFDRAADDSTRVHVELAAGVRVDGRVVDNLGQPVAGAGIWVAAGGRADGGVVATHADGDGRFSLREVAPGYHVAAMAAGHQPSRSVQVPAASDSSVQQELRLETVRGAARVHGRITSTTGKPLAGARIQFGREGPPFSLVDVGSSALRTVTNRIPVTLRTDDDGNFAWDGVAPGETVEVHARAAQHVGSWRTLRLVAGGSHRIDITLEPGTSLRGEIRDGDAASAVGVHVMVNCLDPGVPGWFWPGSTSGEDGSFRLDGLAPGDTELWLFTQSGGATSLDVRVDPARSRPIEVALDELRVTGRVVDRAGDPRSGFVVRLADSRQATTTDTDGAFRLLARPGTELMLTVHDPRCVIGAPSLRRGGASVEHSLLLVVADEALATARVAGRILTALGEPAAGAQVTLRTDGGRAQVSARADAHGDFAFEPVTPGRYELWIEAPNHPMRTVEDVDVRANERIDLGNLQLGVGGRVRCFVTAGRTPVAERVSVRVTGADGRVVYRRHLVDSEHVIRALPVGSWQVTTWGHASALQSQNVVVEPDREVVVWFDVASQRLQRISLAGFDAADNVAARVRWLRPEGAELMVENLELRGPAPGFDRYLLPGRYRLELSLRDGRTASADVVIEADADPEPIWLRLSR